MDDATQLAEFKAALAELLEPAEAEPPPADRPEPTTLVEALHPGAIPVLGEDGQRAFDAALQSSADNFWTGWTS